jgi:hypothetical protein
LKKIILFGIYIVFFSFAAHQECYASGFMGGTFAATMESTAGSPSYDQMINNYYGYVTAATVNGPVAKFGFYLVLAIAFFKFPVVGSKALKDFAVYMGTFLILATPGWNGKCLPIWIADITDAITISIVNSMGGLDAKQMGAGVEFLMATGKAENAAFNQNMYPMADFKEHCYNVVAANTPAGQTVPKASDMQFNPTNVIPGTNQTCTSLQTQLETNLAGAAQSYFDTDMNNLKTAAKPVDLTTINTAIVTEDAVYNSTSGQNGLLNKAISASPTRTQLDHNAGWTYSINEAADSFSLRSTLLYKPREMIVMIGQTTLWVFDYYIFQIVAIIKIFASMGMAFGMLYYLFLEDLAPTVTALGLWMFGNAFYIVATVARNGFYSQLDANLLTAAQTLLGLKSATNDALFSLAFIGVMATSLAGMLTWKSINKINSFFMGHQPGPSGMVRL